MTNKTIIISAIVVLVVGVVTWRIVSPTGVIYPTVPAPTQTVASSTSSATPAEAEPVYQASTLRTVATQGGNYSCALNIITPTESTRGTIYSSGGKTRLDLVYENSSGDDTTTHTIRTASFAYSWVDGQSTGTKTPITASSAIIPKQPTGSVIDITDNGQLSSSCIPWVPDLSQFVPPQGITFVAE